MFTIIGGDGQEYGPVSVDQIRRWLAEGRANRDTRAKRAGGDVWQRLGDWEEFSDRPPVMSAQPPELPAFEPEAAEPELATRGSRLAAAFIDQVLSTLITLPGAVKLALGLMAQAAQSGGAKPSTPFGLLLGLDPEQINIEPLAGALGLILLGQALYAVVQCWLLATRGQSMGKIVIGIRVVRYRDGAPAGLLHAALLRGGVPWLLSMMPWIGFGYTLMNVCWIFGPQKRCLHDLIADTKVIQA
ncbi:MAG: RDD family protein [Opitutae bacterium]|nr:RDD family protein [Opitutae bacterium]